MGWLDSFKKKLTDIVVGPAAGEWAVTAMACMVFADGDAEPEEIAKAKAVVATNPVIKNSLGADKGNALFAEVVAAIETEPRSMLASYLVKLEELAAKVKSQDDKNFALGTVIAVASADGDVEPAEYEMLVKFKTILGATIDLPERSA